MQRAIHNHKGDVYDPFVGSGTTIIAAEQEHRRCYALEIDPAYVDVSAGPASRALEPIRHNHKGDVYDPFVGSGTTIIAAEQEHRRCYALEIDPAYVDVSVKRWEDFTGRKATRVTTP